MYPRGWATGSSVMGAPILMYFSDIASLPIHRSQTSPPPHRQPWLRIPTRQQLVFRSNSEKTDGSGCATARDRTRAPPSLLVFVTKPQNRLNSDNPPEGGLLGKRTASHGTSRVKDSEIKAIMGSDCAERKRGQSRCIGKTSSLSSTDGKIFGSSSLFEV